MKERLRLWLEQEDTEEILAETERRRDRQVECKLGDNKCVLLYIFFKTAHTYEEIIRQIQNGRH